jgi:hypothetical protein
MSTHERRYISYLLRLWQTEDDGGLVWRGSLECPHSGERLGFSSLADLCAYIEDETRDSERGLVLPPDRCES